MKLWKDSQEEVKRIAPDRQMAKAILKMIEVRMKALSLVDRKEFASLVAVEDYYEITKEAVTALMALDGYKTLSHEVLVAYLKEFYPQFSESEILLVDQLRRLEQYRHKGFFITHDFLERTEARMKSIVGKIKRILEDGLAR